MTLDRRVVVWAAFVAVTVLAMMLVDPGMAHAQIDRVVSKAQNDFQSQLEAGWKIVVAVICIGALVTRKPPVIFAAVGVALVSGLLVFGIDAFGSGVDRLARAWF